MTDGAGKPIDLTTIGGKAAGVTPFSPPDKGSPTGVEPGRSIDATRERIAYILLGALGGIVALQAIVSIVFSADCWMHGGCDLAKSSLGLVTSTMSTIFTAMVGLVGSVVGFYFGSQKQGG